MAKEKFEENPAPFFQSPRPMHQQQAAATPTTPVPSIPGTPTGLALPPNNHNLVHHHPSHLSL